MLQIACGFIMLGCVIALALYLLLPHNESAHACFVFVAETIALVAFGVSWFSEGIDIKVELK
jgi:hypothetical protein